MLSVSSTEAAEEKASLDEVVEEANGSSGSSPPLRSAPEETTSRTEETPEEKTEVGAADDDEDLFGSGDKQDSGSKVPLVNDQTDQSPAMTSQLTSDPADAGDVDPLRTAEEADQVHKDDDTSVAVDKDIPLFGDEDEGNTSSGTLKNLAPKNSSLFGDLDEEDDDGLFSIASKSVSAEKKVSATGSRPTSGTTKANASTAKPKRNESDDDLAQKPPPLPLFGDSDDDKDLDWLS